MRYILRMTTALSIAAAGLTFVGPTPGHADANAPVCAQTYGKSDGLSCNYANYDQCRAFISGLGGSCINNPFLRDALAEMPRPRVRR